MRNTFNKLLEEKFSTTDVCLMTTDEWIKYLTKPIFDVLANGDILRGLSAKEADGFSGRVNLSFGFKRYDFSDDNGVLYAHSSDGMSKPILIDDPKGTIKSFSRQRLFELLINKNELSLTRKFEHDKIYLATKRVGTKTAAFMFALDSILLCDERMSAWIEDYLKTTERLVILLPQTNPTVPWALNNNKIQLTNFPSHEDNWLIPTYLYCDARMGLEVSEVLHFYYDKKIIFDRIRNEIYVFGKKLPVSQTSKEFLYLSSLINEPDREFRRDDFGLEKLRFSKNTDIENRIAEIRSDLKTKIEPLFKDEPARFEELKTMFFTAGQAKVRSKFKKEDVLIWE